MKLETNSVFLRQLDIFDEKHFEKQICIIGAGATGSFAALALAKMGMKNIKIWDFDCVEAHNFPNQLFRMCDLNSFKSERTAEIVKDFTGTKIKYSNNKYTKQPLDGIVIFAMDSMKCRKETYERCLEMPEVEFIIDPRTASEFYRVYTVNMELKTEREFYEQFFYSDDNTEQEPCTAQAIIYSVLFAAGTVANQVKQVLSGQDYRKEIIADLSNYMFLTK